MTRIRAWQRRLLCLPAPLTILIAAPSFAAVAFVLAEGVEGPAAYLAYLASSYGLAVTVTGLIRLTAAARRRMARIPLAARLAGDSLFRMGLSLRFGFAMNLLYVALKLAAGIYYRSAWFLALAAYYVLLTGMRFSLLRRENGVGVLSRGQELRRYRLCGLMLFPMDLALSAIVVLMARHRRGYDYPGFLIYAMAAYAFYSVISATVSLVRLRKQKNALLSASKAVKLTAAMVSILALETAMLDRFGTEGPGFRAAAIKATGGGMCAIVLCMAVFMTIHGTRELKKYDKSKL